MSVHVLTLYWFLHITTGLFTTYFGRGRSPRYTSWTVAPSSHFLSFGGSHRSHISYSHSLRLFINRQSPMRQEINTLEIVPKGSRVSAHLRENKTVWIEIPRKIVRIFFKAKKCSYPSLKLSSSNLCICSDVASMVRFEKKQKIKFDNNTTDST